MTSPQGPDKAIELLGDLLATKYNSWIFKAQRMRQGKLNARAIAVVLADYVYKGQATPNNVRQLRDKTDRMLNKGILTRETLDLFIAAFKMSDEDAAELKSLMPRTTKLPSVLTAPAFTVLSLRDVCFVNDHGVPQEQRTTLFVAAGPHGLSRYQVFFDTNRVACEAHDSTVSKLREAGKDWAATIALRVPLAPGERAELSYAARFGYQRPHPYYVRTATQPMSDVTVEVKFSRGVTYDRVTRLLHITETGGGIEEVYKPANGAVTCHAEFLQEVSMGFRWPAPKL